MLRTVSEESPLRQRPVSVEVDSHVAEHAAYIEIGYNQALNTLLSLGVFDEPQAVEFPEETFSDPELE